MASATESREKLADLLHGHVNGCADDDLSRATSPGGTWHGVNGDAADGQDFSRLGRSQPRKFPYTKYLPYETESVQQREEDLDEMIKYLYVAVASGDFVPGATHWTREIRGWMTLKFDLTRRQRLTLVKLYYELALAPGLEYSVAERFASMFMVLTKRKHYLRPREDLILDWRPLYKELKVFVLPSESSTQNTYSSKRNVRTLTKICTFAQLFFDPREIPAMLEEFLPYFSMSFSEHAFVVTGLFNLMLPTSPPPPDEPKLQPQHYLPTFFHLWSTVNRSMTTDMRFIDVFSRLARDCLKAPQVPFSEHGIFTGEQSSLIFTAVLRMLEIPVGQATSPYSATVDVGAGLAVLLDRDQRKHPMSHSIARWIVMSLSASCLDDSGEPRGILRDLEGLIQGIETFFHPSNSGAWTKTLAQLVYYLADFFVMRWNRELSGEYEFPEERKLTPAIKRRFVLCLRDVIFMGIYAKSGTAMNYALSTLQGLTFLEPQLMLPGALQRIYPAMQGLVEVHRMVSSIRALQVLTKTMARTKGFRCHLTSLLGLALPGIDANDLDKTMHSLAFIQHVAYNIPFYDLTKEKRIVDDEEREQPSGTGLALQWVAAQVDRLAEDSSGTGASIDYETELTDADEEMVVRSSTAGLADFITVFLGRVFTLLQNLPDASRVKSGSPEENVVNTLPAAFSPLLAALSPELYDLALQQIAKFVTNHVVHQARDAMAFICNALVKVSPKKALARLLPNLIQSIRTEIADNGAGSTRTTGSEILPRDRALVWNISLLSMCVVHVGSDVLDWQNELFDIAVYMQDTCKGIPLVHVSNFVHHLLLNLTVTYTTDYSIYEQQTIERGLTPEDWGQYVDPKSLNIKWHSPNQQEIDFAIRLFESQGGRAIEELNALISSESPVKRDGTGKDWSDEISRNLTLLRLVISGLSRFFRSDDESITPYTYQDAQTNGHIDHDHNMDDADSAFDLGESEEDTIRKSFQYATGYPLDVDSPQYEAVHRMRRTAGETLHKVHLFLIQHQEDDVPCFSSLYVAYRTWFIDVGIERSAHVLDRLTRLLHADTHPFKVSGTRKEYPRPLLVRRANLYNFARLRYNESPRIASELDKTLLLDLAQSSVSVYTDIRRTAQSASESAVKCIIGAKPLIIPPLLEALEQAVAKNDFPRIKGAIFSLLFGSLAKPISRNWKFAPRLVKLFIHVTEADKPSIQKLVGNASFQIQDMTKAMDRIVILDPNIVDAIWPESDGSPRHARGVPDTIEDAKAEVPAKKAKIKRRRAIVEKTKTELAAELVESIKTSHWKKASRTAAMVIGLDYRFETIASDGMLDLVVKGTIDPHPQLRALYAGAIIAIFNLIQTRALVDHKYENYVLDKQQPPDRIAVPVPREDPDWTSKYLASFAKPEAEYYVDSDYPGWLVWKSTMRAFETSPGSLDYDNVEQTIRGKIGKMLDRHWFSTYFSYMKQEPRDAYADRFRMSSSMIVSYGLELMSHGLTVATFDDIKDLTKATYGDGSDKHQHRATAEIMGAMITASEDFEPDLQKKIWEYVFPIVRKIFQDGLTPENIGYWSTFVSLVLGGKDPRRSWPLVDWLASFRLDMETNAAFKESSKITLLNLVIGTVGWHFQLEKPIVENFMNHLNHPYKGVREVMGGTLSAIFRTRYHESYKDIETLLQSQKDASSIGTRPFEPTPEFKVRVSDVFFQLEQWRLERPAGQQTPSPYTQGSKTVLLWLDTTLSYYDCTSLVSFFPDTFMEPLLHMMDIKEDPELQSLAYHVFRHLPNISHRSGEDKKFVDALIRIGRKSTSWHQRLRILINIQVIYFRHLFLMPRSQQQALLDCVSDMLQDVQLEVRLGAAATISGMVRCSPLAFREQTVKTLQKRFTDTLVANPLPKKQRGPNAPPPGTPTPEQAKLVLTRHSAVLGLGALVQAFPYTSPPPAWLPEVLATLSRKASNDPGMVGKSVKTVLSDFKKTRQDTWHIDVKAFEQEQLEDLEGVLWKSYFA
ncbi:Proteasome activator BLM10 [Elasticomyces elasticus]|nr:Proteasome activator BLM10 [Elasticomyces elasticus]KAK4985674.1 Proteasome activator BLM10 [Elasticomyces elasticus]